MAVDIVWLGSKLIAGVGRVFISQLQRLELTACAFGEMGERTVVVVMIGNKRRGATPAPLGETLMTKLSILSASPHNAAPKLNLCFASMILVSTDSCLFVFWFTSTSRLAIVFQRCIPKSNLTNRPTQRTMSRGTEVKIVTHFGSHHGRVLLAWYQYASECTQSLHRWLHKIDGNFPPWAWPSPVPSHS